MSMTRRHFEAIARAIRENTTHVDLEIATDGEILLKDKIVSVLSDLFQEENPRFDSYRFKEACYT